MAVLSYGAGYAAWQSFYARLDLTPEQAGIGQFSLASRISISAAPLIVEVVFFGTILALLFGTSGYLLFQLGLRSLPWLSRRLGEKFNVLRRLERPSRQREIAATVRDATGRHLSSGLTALAVTVPPSIALVATTHVYGVGDVFVVILAILLIFLPALLTLMISDWHGGKAFSYPIGSVAFVVSVLMTSSFLGGYAGGKFRSSGIIDGTASRFGIAVSYAQIVPSGAAADVHPRNRLLIVLGDTAGEVTAYDCFARTTYEYSVDNIEIRYFSLYRNITFKAFRHRYAGGPRCLASQRGN